MYPKLCHVSWKSETLSVRLRCLYPCVLPHQEVQFHWHIMLREGYCDTSVWFVQPSDSFLMFFGVCSCVCVQYVNKNVNTHGQSLFSHFYRIITIYLHKTWCFYDSYEHEYVFLLFIRNHYKKLYIGTFLFWNNTSGFVITSDIEVYCRTGRLVEK